MKHCLPLFAALALFAGCQQKMADQPAHRPYEESSMFPNNQSVRPLESGVIHRNQKLSDDALLTWLTPAGKNIPADAEWLKSVDPTGTTVPGVAFSGSGRENSFLR